MRGIRRSLWGRDRDEGGATLIFTAVSMIALLGAGAMGVDVGFSVYGSRAAQAMADTAALDMARYVNVADQGASPVTYLNGILDNVDTDNGSNATLTETPGLWQNGTWTPEGGLCALTSPPSAHPCNAVQVTAGQAVPQIFWGGFNVLNGHAGSTVTTDRSSIAAQTPESAFSIGSYLPNFNSQQSGVLNAILGGLGTTANLTAAEYQGMANTDVTVSQLITASGGILTNSNVMTQSLPGNEWSSIWKDAVANQVGLLSSPYCAATPTPSPCNASSGLTALGSWSTSASLCQVVVIDGSSCGSGSLSTSALSAGLNVLQTLTTEAEVANGTSAINVQSALGITGVTASQLFLTVSQLPKVAYGTVGTIASTAQVQADLQLTVSGQVLDIPLTAASGTATLKTLACQYNSMASAKIAVSTTTNTAAITLGGASVATLTISGYGPTPQISFSPTNVPPTASTAAANSNPIAVGSTTPTLSYSGLSTSSPVFTLLTSTLASVLGPILQAAGVTVGGAEVTYLSTNCDAVSLVQ